MVSGKTNSTNICHNTSLKRYCHWLFQMIQLWETTKLQPSHKRKKHSAHKNNNHQLRTVDKNGRKHTDHFLPHSSFRNGLHWPVFKTRKSPYLNEQQKKKKNREKKVEGEKIWGHSWCSQKNRPQNFEFRKLHMKHRLEQRQPHEWPQRLWLIATHLAHRHRACRTAPRRGWHQDDLRKGGGGGARSHTVYIGRCSTQREHKVAIRGFIPNIHRA